MRILRVCEFNTTSVLVRLVTQLLLTRYPPSVSFTFSDLRAFLLPPFSRGRVIAIRMWLIASATSGCAIGLVLILF